MRMQVGGMTCSSCAGTGGDSLNSAEQGSGRAPWRKDRPQQPTAAACLPFVPLFPSMQQAGQGRPEVRSSDTPRASPSPCGLQWSLRCASSQACWTPRSTC